ncbi:hypothetical protein D4764_0268590, partial [Takifugu flavidus]
LNMQSNSPFSLGKSAAMREDLVRQNALTVIRQRGGDPSDKMENDVGSTVYLIKNVQSEEAAGLCMADTHSKDSLQSFVSYALSFQEIQALLTYEAGRGDGVTASSEDDQLVGFGARAKSRWKEIWTAEVMAMPFCHRQALRSRYTRMSRLQQNLLKRQPTTSSTPAEHPMKAPAEPLAMEEDVEMEREMLSIHNSDLQVQSYAMPVAAAALPRLELLDMVAELPSPNFFQLHPFFIWKPESHIMVRLRNNDILPCLHSCPRPQVVSAGVGRPPVIVSVQGWGGVSVSGFYLTDCLLDEFKRQQPSLTKLLQGTLGQVFRSDHTRKMARKQGMAQRYSHAGVGKAGYHWMDSDPELSEGIMDRDGGTLQLNHVAGEGAKVPVWIPVRGTSQQEGYHFQQAQWVTGTQVSPELFQAQAMTGVVRWNFQRPVDMKKPGAVLPAVFDPASMWELNSASMAVTGQDKCPAFTSLTETLEKDDAPGATPSSSGATATAVPSLPPAPPVTFHLSAAGRVKEIPAEDDQDPERSVGGSTIIGFFRAAYVSGALPLPLKSSPRSARTGPMKTGGGVFVLDHTHWTLPMKDAIDSLLQYHHGDKDILRLVDRDYADTVHRSAADPNSLLRPTTRFHISRYVKHLAKLLNTSSSLNTSPEKLLETQQLWYSLTEGSKTTSVPVVTMETAVVTPPTAALPTPLTQDSIESKPLFRSNQRILGGLLDQIENHPETIQKVLNNLKEENSDGISPDRSINIFHCLMEMKDQSVHQEIQEFLKSGEISERRLSEIHCSALAGFSS